MKLYTYELECPECGDTWLLKRLTPYKSNKKKRVCKKCKNPVQDLGGLVGNKKCLNCKHFSPIQRGDKAWGECGRGHVLANEQAYTLSYAIDNLDGCEITEQEHDEYGDDEYGLVHSYDLCKDFERVDNGAG